MEFQFDPIGLAKTVEQSVPSSLKQQGAGSITPRLWLWTRAWRFVRRQFVGEDRWIRARRKAQIVEGLTTIREVIGKSKKPVVAYVVPYDIVKLQTGGGKRVAGIAKSLAARFDIYILSLLPSSCSFSVREIFPGVRMVAIPASLEFEEKSRISTGTRGGAASLFAFADHVDTLSDFQAVLDCLSTKDVWVTTSPMAWPLIQRSFEPTSQVLIYDAHDNLLDFLSSSLRCSSPDMLKRAEELEKEMLAQTSVAAFCTDADRCAARERCPTGSVKTLVVPNGVDMDACPFVPPSRARECRKSAGLDRPVVVFVGAHHKPNYEAVDVILRELAPAFPDVIFVVVGMYLAPYREFGGAEPAGNVVFTGPVSEETKEVVFSFSDIALAPMKTGTGSSLKIPEYIAHGKVVLGTPTGLRGFEAFTGFSSVIAVSDIRKALDQVLKKLGENPNAFTSSCSEARAFAKTTLDWSVAARPLLDVLNPQIAGGVS